MYSGEREASIRALVSNLRYSRSQNICPIKTSEYCSIADGFFTSRLYKIGKNSWRVEDRDGLQTIRFDNATCRSVDFSNSKGVVGQKHLQGSLYIYLDMGVKSPEITLKKNNIYWKEPLEKRFYLIDSRWQILDVKQSTENLTFKAYGFGEGRMSWNVPDNGFYSIKAGEQVYTAKAEGNVLKMDIDLSAIDGVSVSVKSIKTKGTEKK